MSLKGNMQRVNMHCSCYAADSTVWLCHEPVVQYSQLLRCLVQVLAAVDKAQLYGEPKVDVFQL